MLLRQLEYLVALAREGHFARAAEACHVSQPSLSAGIRKLERELGTQVVQRGARYAGLTPEGERVLVWAQRILAERDALNEDLSTMRDSLSGVLRVGAIPTALTAMSMLTAPFCERHPHARVTLESLSSDEIARRLTAFELDAGLTYVDEEPPHGLRCVPLYEERYLLLTPSDGELAGRRLVRWAEVATLPLCLLMPHMRNRRVLDALFAEAGATVVPAIETDTVSALYSHVATHHWSSVISHAWLHLFGVPPGMRVVPLETPSRSHRIGLMVTAGSPEPILARALLEVVRGVDVRGTLDALLHRHLAEQAP
ncbi:LysR family transcriptional regulator [Amycolatopsis sp. NBC_01307]|uniref:LysR family transcriptional regulator n=1 Tax=Amycolatopsis sp. NBC_01307 TaxID=2903561 RepID=UPI002E102D26|nr:LysR family transcriptional regulator [Amycolatopsis sp. NBC_01307]